MSEEAKLKRDALIERIRKLQRLTIERGASEAEALQAAAFAAKLIAENAILASELDIRADAKNCIRDAYVCWRVKQPTWTRVCVNIERLYGTICWIEKQEEDLLGLGFTTETLSIVYYGFPVDVAGSIATLAIVSQALENETAKMRGSRLQKQSFELGFCDRVNERLREMRTRSMNAFREATKGALVVLKDKLVKEEFEKLGVKLSRSMAKDQKIDVNAYARGKAAGGSVALDRQVRGGERGRLT